ncbi:MAG: DUF1565 domain-containing protein [Proteobacteria bacterium]|nr:DUF1565 domain-containing protein [Pseudomonadota bacterium]
MNTASLLFLPPTRVKIPLMLFMYHLILCVPLVAFSLAMAGCKEDQNPTAETFALQEPLDSTAQLQVGKETKIAPAADFYVALGGSDAQAGTIDAPFATIQHALEQAKPGNVVALREGVYRQAVKLTAKSGTEGQPITLTAHGAEKAIISGLDVLKLEWQETPQVGVYVASFDAKSVSQLFFDRKPLLEARWPNVPRDAKGDWNFFAPEVWARVDAEGNSYGTIVDSDLAATGWDVTGAQALLNVDHQFFAWTRPVMNHTAGSTTFNYATDLGTSVFKKDEQGGNPHLKDDLYFLFGMRQFLDVPGEWFFDAAAKQLYVYAPNGKNPATGQLEIKKRDWGFTADKDSNHLTIDGIEFFGTAFKFGNNYNSKSKNIVFCNNSVTESSSTDYLSLPQGHPFADLDKIMPTMDVDNSQVINNTFAFGALSGLIIGGFDNLIENNLFTDFCYTTSLTYPPLQVSKAWPAMVGKAGRAIVRHNTFARSGGIQVQVAQEGNQFYLNEIRDSFLACYGGNKDTSALYTQNVFCSGTRFHHNWVHGAYSGTPPFPWGGGLGIRGDDKTCGLTIDHNVTWNLGAAGIEIKNVDNPTPEQGNRCVSNTVFNHSAYTPIKTAILIPSTKNNWNSESTVVNNLADSYYGWWGGKPMGPLKVYSNNSAAFDPYKQLVNPTWFDFRPSADAAGIIDGGLPVEGITGAVVGSAPDIGAYERGDSVYWIPGQRLAKASFPIVPDRAKDVPADRDALMWKPAYGAVTHTVRFSASEDGLASAAPQTFQSEANVFKLPQLSGGQTYFWRVDATLPDQTVVKGDVWSFSSM